jgi:hypothetical protein
MTIEQTPADPAATQTTTQGAPPAAAPPAHDQEPATEPTWLKARLDRERAKGLRDAGFESVEAAKAAADAIKSQDEAKKSAEQRAAESAAAVATEKARADRLAAITSEHAARMMLVLTAEQRAAIMGVAGDDPAAQLRAIGALAPTWAKQEAAAAPAPEAPPATTAPARSAPNGAAPAQPDPRSVYEQTRQSNPFAAAYFGASNPAVYDRR